MSRRCSNDPMTWRFLVAVSLLGGLGSLAAGPPQIPPEERVPPAIAALLAQARARLRTTRDVNPVVSLDVAGIETRLSNPRPKDEPYAFKLLLPDSFQWRSGPILQTLARGVYGRRLLDSDRYTGTFVGKMVTDPESQKAAAQTIHFHFMRMSLTYLARVPAGMNVTMEDQGVRDFGKVKGRTISFDDSDRHIRIELVLDAATAQPLATVAHGRTARAGASTDTDWISMLGDYREVSGVRFPHRTEEWIGAAHSRIVVSKVAVNVLKPEDFGG